MPSATAKVLPKPRPPRALNVVRDPLPEEVGAPIDWSGWYLTDEEDMGEGGEQEQIIGVAKSALRELARERGWQDVHVAGDQFFAWIESEPFVRVSPDLYLLDHPPPPPLPPMWQTWTPGHRAPRFAVEVVSPHPSRTVRWQKDYEDAPAKYAQLGTAELVIFDPDAAAGRGGDARFALQTYRRDDDGVFTRVYRGDGPVHGAELDAWLVVVVQGPVARLRIARDPEGRDLVPTETERADREAERAEREARRAEDAERENAELRAELERLRRG